MSRRLAQMAFQSSRALVAWLETLRGSSVLRNQRCALLGVPSPGKPRAPSGTALGQMCLLLLTYAPSRAHVQVSTEHTLLGPFAFWTPSATLQRQHGGETFPKSSFIFAMLNCLAGKGTREPSGDFPSGCPCCLLGIVCIFTLRKKHR